MAPLRDPLFLSVEIVIRAIFEYAPGFGCQTGLPGGRGPKWTPDCDFVPALDCESALKMTLA